MRSLASLLAFLLLAACAAPPPVAPARLHTETPSWESSWHWTTQPGGTIEPLSPRLALLPNATIATVEIVLFVAAPPAVAGPDVHSAAAAIDFALALDDHRVPRPSVPSRPARELRCLRGAAAQAAFAALAVPGWPYYFSLLRDELLLDDGVMVGRSKGWSEPLDAATDVPRAEGAVRKIEPDLGVELELRGDQVRVVVVRGARGVDAERLLLRPPLTVGEGPLLVQLPSPFHGGRNGWCAIRVDLRRVAGGAGDGPEAARLAELAEEFDRGVELNAEEAEKRAAAAAAAAAVAPAPARVAYRPPPRSGDARAHLTWLAARWPGTLIADLALLADDALLTELFALEEAQHAAGAPHADEAALVAGLERAALATLAARLHDAALAPELQSVARRHAGAVADAPGTLESLARSGGTVAALQARFVAENRLLLEDAHAAVRVQAFDWLVRRDAAPAGFDPLAPAAQRRAALAAAAAAAPTAIGDGP